ncbi:MAG: SMP-30/gluconolactonase/LRE family protein [Planctomycetota bacterium]
MLTCAAATGDRLGEGPVWLPNEHALRWVDIEGRRWHAMDVETGALETIELDRRLTAFAPIEGTDPIRFIAAFDAGLAICDGRGSVDRWLHTPEADRTTNRFNDGGADAAGRFLAGTMNEHDAAPTGSLYVLDARAELRTLRTGLGIANTIAFSPDGRTLYTADSATSDLAAFRYDPDTGTLGERIESFRPSPDLPGVPDGSAMDAEGYLWNARWDGRRVLRLAPDGSLDRELELPVSRPTSCAFVGSKLYITTAIADLTPEQLRDEPQAGSLFVADVGVEGVPRPPVARDVAGL